MGGVFLTGLVVAVALAFGDRDNAYLRITLVTAAALCGLGTIDDWIKLRTAQRGLSARSKLAAQAVIAIAATTLIYSVHLHVPDATKLNLPWVGSFEMGCWFVPWAALVVIASSNAVNLTDGLDGLAGGCLVWSAAALSLVAFIAGRADLAAALGAVRSWYGRDGRRLRGFRWRCPGVPLVQLSSGIRIHGRRRVAAARRGVGARRRHHAARVVARRDRRCICRRSIECDHTGRVVSMDASTRVLVRATASPLSIARLARGQDRGAVLDCGRLMRRGRPGDARNGGDRVCPTRTIGIFAFRGGQGVEPRTANFRRTILKRIVS